MGMSLLKPEGLQILKTDEPNSEQDAGDRGECVTGEEKGEREVHLDQEQDGQPCLGLAGPRTQVAHVPPTDTPCYHPSFSLAAI